MLRPRSQFARHSQIQSRSLAILLIAALAAAWPAIAWAQDAQPQQTAEDREAALLSDVTQGALRILQPDGGVVECPLVHTDVQAEISGYLARVNVTQTFRNPESEPIEAVYVFPLPHQSAVDRMTMQIGERNIKGIIMRRDEARAVYEVALLAGQTAALLEQERPNIFTQSVGNIPPGEEIRVEISYVDVLKYDIGTYEFSFPMVVGPRFNPGGQTAPAQTEGVPAGAAASGAATSRVPDGDRINPPVLLPGTRTGHDISLAVSLDAGVPVQDMEVRTHQASIERNGPSRAIVKLNELDSLPNKDFVLRYKVTGEKPSMALLPYTGTGGPAMAGRSGDYFMLMVQPGDDEALHKAPPREIVFLVDTSGSMSGAPTDKVKEIMGDMLKLCRPNVDTLQLATFASQATNLFPAPVPVNDENINRAIHFTDGVSAGGGTNMLEGVKLAMDAPLDPERVRIIIMLTDGYIGNEAEIIEHVGKQAGDQIRFWCVGIGASPNMFLIDGVARQGEGMGKQLNLNDDSQTLATEIITRIQRAQLSHIQIDWGNLDVFDTFPAKIPELWAGRPIILFGRYRPAAGQFQINVRGQAEGTPVEWPLVLDLPESEPNHDVVATMWARQKIEDLMHQAYYGDSPAVEEAVTSLALDYNLMSQYTSFVAVDSTKPPVAGGLAKPPRKMLVPVPLPEGTRWEGFFGGPAPQPQPLAAGELRLQEEFKSDVLRELAQSESGDQSTASPVSPAILAGVPLGRTGGSGGRGRGGGGGGFGGGAGAGAGARGQRGGRRGRGGQSARAAGPPPAALPGPIRALQGGLQAQGAADAPANGRPAYAFALDALRFDNSPAATRVAIGEESDAEKNVQLRRLAIDANDPLSGAFIWDFRETATHYNDLANAALEEAQKAIDDKHPEAAQEAAMRAFYFDETQINRGQGSRGVAVAALALLEDLRADQVAAWTKAAPALDKRLDLVLQDVSLDEAIAKVAAAAGEKVDVVQGSLDDASDLVADTRITYLDLRGATLAQALDWIATPARLTWRLDGSQIRVGSARRLPGESVWVYNVVDMAIPQAADLGDPSDAQGFATRARDKTAEFLAAVQKATGLEKKNVHWFAPGMVMVIGDAAAQEKVTALLADLADTNAPAASDLHNAVRARLAARRQARAKQEKDFARLTALASLDAYGWRLLAAAVDGKMDERALAELAIAWKSVDHDSDNSADRFLQLRTAWIVAESARALPDNADMASFEKIVRTDTAAAAKAAIDSLAEANNRQGFAYLAGLYAALANRDNADLASAAKTRLTAESNDALVKALAASVAPILLGDGGQDHQAALAELVASPQFGGDDAVALTALAARKAGGQTWRTFRTESRDKLAGLPLSGDVVVLVNELAGSQAPLVVQAGP